MRSEECEKQKVRGLAKLPIIQSSDSLTPRPLFSLLRDTALSYNMKSAINIVDASRDALCPVAYKKGG